MNSNVLKLDRSVHMHIAKGFAHFGIQTSLC
jgi:hypothetical protein